MEVVLLIIHILCSIALVVVILLQSGKGGGLGAGFGGAGAAATQIFGGRGAGNFLSRTTVVLATIFMATSLTLAYLSSQPRSLMDLEADGGAGGAVEDEIIEEGSGPAPTGGEAVPPTQPAPSEPAAEEEEGGEANPAAGGFGIRGNDDSDSEGESAGGVEDAADEAADEAAPDQGGAEGVKEEVKEEAGSKKKMKAPRATGSNSGSAGSPVEAKPEEEILPGVDGDDATKSAE